MSSRDNSIPESTSSRRRGVTAGGDGEAAPGSVNADPGAQPMLPAIIPPPKAAEDTLDSSDFDWSDPKAIVIAPQRRTAVYWAPNGELVIRQQSPMGDQDTVITIAEDQADKFLDAVCDICGIPSFGGPG